MEHQVLTDVVSPTVIYIGTADLGRATNESYWTIKKVSVSGNITTISYPCGSGGTPLGDELFEWDDRALYTYSLTPSSIALSSEVFATLDTFGATGSGTLTFSAPVLSATIGFFNDLTNEPCEGTVAIDSGFGTVTLAVSYTAPTVTENIDMRGTVTGYGGHSETYETTPYLLF